MEKGSRKNRANFRTISLLIPLSKISETLLYKRMMAFCAMNELLTPEQHGFGPKPSCSHAILSKTEIMSHAIEKKEAEQAFFIDLQKPLDNLDHITMLRKIERYSY